MLKAMRGTVVVEPMYDLGGAVPAGTPYHANNVKIEGHEVYGMVIAATGENPQSQQGIVVSSGIDEFVPGMCALYMPFHGFPLKHRGKEYLSIPDRELAAWLVDRDVMPRKGHLLIRPEFPSEKTRSGLLYLPQFVGAADPVETGHVVRGGAFTSIESGTRVVIPKDRGFEIGTTENLYVINEQYIPATLHNDL